MRTPLLQLIHVSDLHFRKGRSDRAALALSGRLADRKARVLVEKHDIGGWHEGTLGHDQTAVTAFREWLLGLRSSAPAWFGDPGRDAAPQTWLVDTGDATTFGDAESLAEARKRLVEWHGVLQPCRLRTLYGNHDAWPDTQPAFRRVGYDTHQLEQRSRIRQWDEWCQESWRTPLRVGLPGKSVYIECHALNTVSFAFMDNVLAVGRVNAAEVDELVARLMKAQPGGLHIVAMHHPLAFPYESHERRVAGAEQMVLSDASVLVDRLRNDVADPDGQGRSPLAHLFLSGHTHKAHPAIPLPPNLQTLYQGGLSTKQAQFVTGSLLLPRDFAKVRANAQPAVVTRDNPSFATPQIYDATQQFELLRFFHDDHYDDGVMVERYVLARCPAGGSYRVVPELSSSTAAFIGL